jgi:hypothetical protein
MNSRNEIFLRACEKGYFMVAESYCFLYKDLDFEAGYKIASANHRRSIKRMITSNVRVRKLAIGQIVEGLNMDKIVYADIGGHPANRSINKDDWVRTGLTLIVFQATKRTSRKGILQLPDELFRMLADFLRVCQNPYILNVA